MRTRYGFRLDGVDLSDLAPEIIPLDIAYDAPVREVKTTALAGRDGQVPFGITTSSQSVTVYFEIHTQNIRRRAEVLSSVREWAMRGGWLTTDDMEGKRLRVLCESPPSLPSSLKWTQRLSATFTAYAFPFWEDSIPSQITMEGNQEKSVFVPGYAAPAEVEVSVSNTGRTAIRKVSLSAGKTTMTFEGLTLPAGKTLDIGHDERGILYAVIDGVGVLSTRTAASSDELILEAGARENVSVQTDGTAKTCFKIRGRY